ncbi:MAG: hypothetical protein DRQ44_12115 [Gammaproteobacteria bacterium]|nr:MAG: hypothetical protein DRQ44_12115 [Gammaproteobacteria bacterium]
MTKYKRRGHAEWQRILQQQKSSGLNVKVFCQQQRLSSKTFYKYRRDLSASPASDTPTASFIKITKPTLQATTPADTVSVLHYGSSQLHIRPECDTQWLAKLLQALS